jgi:hypothetical protein
MSRTRITDLFGLEHPFVREGIRFIETAGRNPEPDMAQLKSAGIIKEKYFRAEKQR